LAEQRPGRESDTWLWGPSGGLGSYPRAQLISLVMGSPGDFCLCRFQHLLSKKRASGESAKEVSSRGLHSRAAACPSRCGPPGEMDWGRGTTPCLGTFLAGLPCKGVGLFSLRRTEEGMPWGEKPHTEDTRCNVARVNCTAPGPPPRPCLHFPRPGTSKGGDTPAETHLG
jgi:hypothetical protein